jgi:formylglycine-generating enzyme required for sulfatase activity
LARDAQVHAQASEPPKEISNEIGMRFVWIPAGTFQMGSPETEKGRKQDETQHKVTLTKGFYLGVTTVTQGQWKAVMGNNLSHFKGSDDLPVEWLNWEDCQRFLRKIGEKDGYAYRLPTEAEWEYACRARSTEAYNYGPAAEQLGQYAWYRESSGSKTHPVGQKKPNAWGLYDMHGNVLQWCADWYAAYPRNAVVDPKGPTVDHSRIAEHIRELSSQEYVERQRATKALKAIGWMALPALRAAVKSAPDLETRRRAEQLVKSIPDDGSGRVLRGGAFYDEASGLRAARRIPNLPGDYYYSFGFRAVRDLPPK